MVENATTKVLVTGATGNTGKAVVAELRRRGIAMRLMLRDTAQADPGSATVEAVAGDFDDRDSLMHALDGVGKAYLVAPSSSESEARQIAFAECAAEAGVEHVVKLSQLGADEASPVRFLRYHASVEKRIRELGIPFTFLRPNLYMQGLLAFAASIAREGKLYAPIGGARVSAIDVRDIGATAAKTLAEDGHAGKTYTLTGPQAVTHVEIATAIGKATGREVSFADVPPDTFESFLLKSGVPEYQSAGLVEDYAHYARGEASMVSGDVRTVTGRDPRGIEQFASDYATAFRAG